MIGAERAAVEHAMRIAGVAGRLLETLDLAGGCTHRVRLLTMDDGSRLVAKCNTQHALPMFEEEAIGLDVIAATRTVITPSPLAVTAHDGHAVLLLTFVEPPAKPVDRRAWSSFGAELAAMHSAPLTEQLARGYGFFIDNHIGSTPQPNRWCEDWVEFNAMHRLGHQMQLAGTRGLIDSYEARVFDSCVNHVDAVLPRRPRPSLLHGDLWSGNIIAAIRKGPDASPRTTMAVIDPAPYVGDALADIAMMRLFGGFEEVCFQSWSAALNVDLNSNDSQRRIAAYQLYHVLNHVNIFGRGYVAQAVELARRMLGQVR